MQTDKLIAAKIYDIRQRLSLTQAQFGKILGSSFQSVCAWEKGRNTPDIETISKIVNMAGITYDDFFSDNSKIQEESDSMMYVTPEERSYIYKLRSMDSRNKHAFETILMNFK